MTDYTHVLLVNSTTAKALSDEVVNHAGTYGVGMVIINDDGLIPLSKEFDVEEIRRLSMVLPKGVTARKANSVLHKLTYRLKTPDLAKLALPAKEKSIVR